MSPVTDDDKKTLDRTNEARLTLLLSLLLPLKRHPPPPTKTPPPKHSCGSKGGPWGAQMAIENETRSEKNGGEIATVSQLQLPSVSNKLLPSSQAA